MAENPAEKDAIERARALADQWDILADKNEAMRGHATKVAGYYRKHASELRATLSRAEGDPDGHDEPCSEGLCVLGAHPPEILHRDAEGVGWDDSVPQPSYDNALRWIVVQARATEMQRQCPDWRRGQALFNALHDMYPSLAERIRGTAADPFNNDSRECVQAFAAAVMEGMGDVVLRPRQEHSP